MSEYNYCHGCGEDLRPGDVVVAVSVGEVAGHADLPDLAPAEEYHEDCWPYVKQEGS